MAHTLPFVVFGSFLVGGRPLLLVSDPAAVNDDVYEVEVNPVRSVDEINVFWRLM